MSWRSPQKVLLVSAAPCPATYCRVGLYLLIFIFSSFFVISSSVSRQYVVGNRANVQPKHSPDGHGRSGVRKIRIWSLPPGTWPNMGPQWPQTPVRKHELRYSTAQPRLDHALHTFPPIVTHTEQHICPACLAYTLQGAIVL